MAKQAPSKRAVWINPGAVASDDWESHIQEVDNQLKEGQFVDTLKVPLSRHSTLTELQSFISLLLPKNIYPTSNMPSLEGLDWACLPGIFAECLTPDGYETLRCSTLEGLRKRFPNIDLTPEGMNKRVEQVLLKVGHPDLEQDNAVGSDEIEWTEARFQRATKTKEHIETYLPWLFGRQDTSSLKATQDASEANSPGARIAPLISFSTDSTSPTIEPGELCATCANCPTCRPKPPKNSPPKSLDAEGIKRNSPCPAGPKHTPSPATGSLDTHTIGAPAQRNEQMYSPPPESPKSHLGSETPTPGTSAIIGSGGRPKKRSRIDSTTSSPRNSSTVPKQSEVVNSSPEMSLNRTQISPSAGTPPPPAQLNLSTKTVRKFPRSSPKDHTSLNDSRQVSHLNLASNDSPQPRNIYATQGIVGSSSDGHSRYNNERSNDITTIPPANMNLPTFVIKSPTPLSESDTRERRRISKVKERNIRAQLAKLPPEFSQALAATKATTKP
ncbi:unnamed protein product [Rhizoctonia solani]|uniref:DNA repair metallo-beta-lactamase domain-containing protein n=1 Tax=Rhizoctonia solani TaxID=456999 RepID=A0A8H2WMD7_9AGAM|nr:unnamed protein product [Rhizoctonia solani]